jgi:putative transposase
MPDGGPRVRGFDYKGRHQYSLTICVHDRRSVFVHADIVGRVLTQIQLAADRNGFAILAYCFMPDHLHLLVEGVLDDADLQKFMKSWKQKTGFDYSKANAGQRLWQVGFFDHVLRSEESTHRHARYILANPVRAGLVQSIDEYPFAGPHGVWPDAESEQARDGHWVPET